MSYASIFRNDLFRDRVALITGGGSGIGRCIAHELAALGAKVILASRDPEKLDRAQKEITEDGGRAWAMPCNIRSEAEVEALYARAKAEVGPVDLLVNNGGGQFVSPAESISLKGWNAVIETNLTGTFLMCRGAHRQNMGEKGGAIVNIVADMWCGMPMMAHSGAARAGVVNLTQTLALEWAKDGIRINAVAPGVIDSSGLDAYPAAVQEALKEVPKELPFLRFGTESEVSALVAFLLSPGAQYISGETICVDGASSLYQHTFRIPSGTAPGPFDGFHRARRPT